MVSDAYTITDTNPIPPKMADTDISIWYQCILTKYPLVDVLTTTPNRRARSAVCLTVKGSDGSPAGKGRGDSSSNRVRMTSHH